MDIINLIRAVKCREPIWNRQHPQYKDREYSMHLWAEVAEEVGIDIETARYKWRGLRDTFRVQLRKLNQPQNKKSKGQSPLKWEYFDEMMFVKDQIYIDVNRRKYYGKEREVLEEKEEIEDKDDDCEDYQGLADFCITEVTEEPDGQVEFNAESDGNEDVASEEEIPRDNTFIESDLQKKLRSLQDDNYCFLMSILPQLKSLPDKQKLYIRIKIQEMLLAEVLILETQE